MTRAEERLYDPIINALVDKFLNWVSVTLKILLQDFLKSERKKLENYLA